MRILLLMFLVAATVPTSLFADGNSIRHDATLEKRLAVFNELRAIARENCKHSLRESSAIPAVLQQRIERLIPDTLPSDVLFIYAIIFYVSTGDLAEDSRYNHVFFTASDRCIELLVDRRDGLQYLERLKPICGSDGRDALFFEEYLAKARKKDWGPPTR